MSKFIPVPIKSKRPTKRDKFVVAKAVDFAIEPVLAWLRQDDPEAGKDEQDLASIRSDIEEALGGWDLDGYKLAKRLDDWDPDAALVEVLSNADSWVTKAHDLAVGEWVQIHTPPTVPDGTQVAFKERAGGKLILGTVTRSYGLARFVVNCPSLGHGPGAGRIIEYENLETPPEGPEKTVIAGA